jgi:hypothetical protein
MVTGNRMLPVYRRCQNFSTNTLLAHGSHNRHGRGWVALLVERIKPNCGRQLDLGGEKILAGRTLVLRYPHVALLRSASRLPVESVDGLPCLGRSIRTLYRVSSTFVVVRVFILPKNSLRAVDQSTGSFERLRETF